MKKPWDTAALIARFEDNRNPELAAPMAAYMKHHFPFLGIQKPLRTALMKEQLSAYLLPEKAQLKSIVQALYAMPEREYHYAAIELLEKAKKELAQEDLPFLRLLIESNSWWDTVDAIAPKLAGHIVLLDRKTTAPILIEWAHAENLWTQRAAILHQLKFKQQTDREMLGSIISLHAESREFFIQKSIGWALREYAKTDPIWVLDFVSTHTLQPLSRREALKHMKK
ncbi:DNA alkylation repair protein [Planococcus alpniumensis]|uniref:DNA alkylation repair protein n=1 Tax=Planococcus alpniumensis TaxID=2708345 RepID=UPI001B8BA277|nr:DNA alkylation repair protein [Planococcus sp. MSAK28401]